MATDVVIALGDDWSGLYVNRKLVYEDHRLRADDVCRCLVGHTIATFSQGEVDLAYLEEYGSLPENINEVKWEIAPPEWAIGA